MDVTSVSRTSQIQQVQAQDRDQLRVQRADEASRQAQRETETRAAQQAVNDRAAKAKGTGGIVDRYV